MDGPSLSPYTCKRCIVFTQFDGLNLDGLAGKRQERQNLPRQNFALYGIFSCICRYYMYLLYITLHNCLISRHVYSSDALIPVFVNECQYRYFSIKSF